MHSGALRSDDNLSLSLGRPRADNKQTMTSALLPIAWPPAMMRNGQDDYRSGVIFVVDRIGKVSKDVVTNSIFVFRPHAGAIGKAINCRENIDSECLGRKPTALTVPKKSLA